MESILPLLERVREASHEMRLLEDQYKKEILFSLAALIKEHQLDILEENRKDALRMDDSNPKKDRLFLDLHRVFQLIENIQRIANLPDPTRQVLSNDRVENGLTIKKVTTPLGVVGIIYESRPNVTIDVAALCIRSGNACVLRGGSDAYHTNKYLVGLIHQAMEKYDVNLLGVQLLPTNRKFVNELLAADKYIDIIIPRGSQELIDFVRENTTVPTIETGAGVCHTFVSKSADLQKARDIVVNAKVSRPSVCNALDTLLVERPIATTFLPMIIPGMREYKVEILAEGEAFDILEQADYGLLDLAEASDFGREFLGFKCSVKVVDNINEALQHIQKYSSKHSEAIISEEEEVCQHFLDRVDAAAVYANASTRFTDGGVFGLGAEIGISTQKLHARGPFALEKLVTEKWVITGQGQVRA
ncbi:MAG: glutamate-5-semialdehyde dehydrogenase [Cyclobacteriaceae bacterium]